MAPTPLQQQQPAFTIRPALPRDIPAITAIYTTAVLHTTASYDLEPPTEDAMAARMATILADGFPYLITMGQNKLLHGLAATVLAALPFANAQ
ncbi:hypothetical protein C8A05DRAFT_39550, partial [Staphylotrichum tortipilum]